MYLAIHSVLSHVHDLLKSHKSTHIFQASHILNVKGRKGGNTECEPIFHTACKITSSQHCLLTLTTVRTTICNAGSKKSLDRKKNV